VQYHELIPKQIAELTARLQRLEERATPETAGIDHMTP
jgi:hypothetical protein